MLGPDPARSSGGGRLSNELDEHFRSFPLSYSSIVAYIVCDDPGCINTDGPICDVNSAVQACRDGKKEA
jgi:hypothetical protein